MLVKTASRTLFRGQTTFSFRSEVGFPTFHIIFFLPFHNFYSHSHIFSHKISNLHGVKLSSGTFPVYWNFWDIFNPEMLSKFNIFI